MKNIYENQNFQKLEDFDSSYGFDRGRSLLVMIGWYIVQSIFISSRIPWPRGVKILLLRLFGAKIGSNLVIRPRLYIHLPWKLTIGNNCWLGERCEFLNFEEIKIMDNVAIAHDVYLAAAGHNPKSRSLRYKHRPIIIESGCWIATRAYIGPGVRVGEGAVVAAGCVVVKDVPSMSIVGGNPAKVIGDREISDD